MVNFVLNLSGSKTAIVIPRTHFLKLLQMFTKHHTKIHKHVKYGSEKLLMRRKELLDRIPIETLEIHNYNAMRLDKKLCCQISPQQI